MPKLNSYVDHNDVFQILREQVPFDAVVGQYAKGEITHGRTFCPLQEQNSGSPAFTIYEDGVAYCHSCGFSGDVTKFYQQINDLPGQYEAAKQLAASWNIELPQASPVDPLLKEAQEKEREEQRAREDVNRVEVIKAHERLLDPDKGKRGREYLKSRGFSKEVWERFLLGYIPGRESHPGFISIPYWTTGGRLNGIVRRDLSPDATRKYLAPSNDVSTFGGRTLFIPGKLPTKGAVLLVEGYLDAIAGAAIDLPTIGSGDALFSKNQRNTLRDLKKRHPKLRFYRLPDKDIAGADGALDIVRDLYPNAFMCETVPDGKDLADTYQACAGDPECIKEIVAGLISGAKDAWQLALEDILREESTHARYKLAVQDAIPLLLKLDDNGERNALISDMAKQAKIKVGDLQDAFRKQADAAETRKIERKAASHDGDSKILVKGRIPDAPVFDDAVFPAGYKVGEQGMAVSYEDKDGNIQESWFASAPMVITKRHDDVEDETVAVDVAWKTSRGWRTRTFDRSVTATARTITSLADYGAPVNSNNASQVVAYLSSFEAANPELPTGLVMRRMGWHKESFLAGDTYIGTGDPIAFRGPDVGNVNLAHAVSCGGSLDGWRDTVSDVMTKYPRIALGIQAAFAAPLLEILGCRSFTLEYAGETTGGKTTTLQACASVWGEPVEDAMILNWDSTQVGIERTCGTLHNIPVFLDETKTVRRGLDPGQVIYHFSGGRGRSRGSRAGLADTPTWRTVMFITGEQTVTSFSKHAGQFARIITLWGAPFNEKSEEAGKAARRLTAGVTANYGWAGREFVRWLLEHKDEWDEWREGFIAVRDKISETATFDEARRMADYLAVIEIAGVLATRVLGLPEVSPSMTLLNDIYSEAEGANKPREAARVAIALFHSRQSQFFNPSADPGSVSEPSQGWLGHYDTRKEEEVSFFPDMLTKHLEDLGFTGIESIYRTWKERGWLKVGSDRKRNTKQVRVAGGKAWLLSLDLTKVEEGGGE